MILIRLRDCATAKADLNLRRAHVSKGPFSDVVASIQNCKANNCVRNTGIDIHSFIFVMFSVLTLVLPNPDIPCLCKQCRSRSSDFWRSQLIWICIVCHSLCEFISTIWIKEPEWLTIRSGRGILNYSAWQRLNGCSVINLCRSTCKCLFGAFAGREGLDRTAQMRSTIKAFSALLQKQWLR